MSKVGCPLALAAALLLLAACAPLATPTPLPATAPASTLTPSPPPADPCTGVPAATSGDITPPCDGTQAKFTMDIWGFTPNEEVGFWLDSWNHGMIAGTRQTVSIGPTGSSEDLYFYPYEFDLQPDTYQWVFQGVTSGHQAILPFRVLP